jgi:hypothetical protein
MRVKAAVQTENRDGGIGAAMLPITLSLVRGLAKWVSFSSKQNSFEYV